MSQIKLTDPSTKEEYTLEFNRRTVRVMEQQGFKITEVQDKPMTMLPELFVGAFAMHHPFMKSKEINAIYDEIVDKEGFIEALVNLYSEPIEALMAEPDKIKGKNVTWSLNK